MKVEITLLAIAALAGVISLVFLLIALQERRLRPGALVPLALLVGSLTLFAMIGGGNAL